MVHLLLAVSQSIPKNMEEQACTTESCHFQKEQHQALEDTLYILGGKWKLYVIHSIYCGNKRFREIERSLPGITTRMLSKVLKELEMNKLIKRTVHTDISVTVEYTPTEYAKSLESILGEMIKWGMQHRTMIRQG